LSGNEFEDMYTTENGNGWAKWGQHVLLELTRQNQCINDLADEVGKIKIENAVLKLKSGIWGAIGASIPILIAIIIWLLQKSHSIVNTP